jgi:lipoyl-dependent peroxiredoxin
MTEKLYFTGKTHTTSGRDGATRSSDGKLDLKLSEPHPMAENLFAAAWSACYLAALELAASQQKVKLAASPSVDTEIKLFHSAPKGYFLRARLHVAVPGVDDDVARRLADAAHGICPYSKAVHGNIEIETNAVGTVDAELNPA